jgi:hypothetical protein
MREQSLSWKATSRSASQEILRNFWNTNVQYRFHKSPPLVRIPRHMYLVHSPNSMYLKSISVLPSYLRLGLRRDLFPWGHLHRNPECTSPVQRNFDQTQS